jgi:hypothetical protein
MTKLNPNRETQPTDEEINKLARLKCLKDPLTSDAENKDWARKVYSDIKRRVNFYSRLNLTATLEENWCAAERDVRKELPQMI